MSVSGPSSAAAGWVPTDSTAELWLDAGDATTVTLNSGVQQLDDKSGNDRHATQNTPSQRPAYDAVNGALDFPDQTGDRMEGTWPSSVITGDWVWAMVIDWTNLGGGGGYNTFFQFGTSDTAMNLWHYNNASWKVLQMYVNSGGAATETALSTNTAPGKFLLSATKSGSDWEVFKNGTSTCSGTRAIGTITGTQTWTLMDGGLSTATNPMGKMHEMAMVSVLSDRQKLEGYLAWHNGIQASLPIGHPYKDAAP